MFLYKETPLETPCVLEVDDLCFWLPSTQIWNRVMQNVKFPESQQAIHQIPTYKLQ